MYSKFDVVIVGSGGAGLMAAMQLPNASVAVLYEGLPDALAHRRGAGRRGSRARQPGRRSLEMAYVRHRQGW